MWNQRGRRTLGTGIQLWVARLDTGFARDCLERRLTSDERERAARFRFERDRLSYAYARGVLRLLLGSLLGMDAYGVPLRVGAHGKPELVSRELEFNVSHSGELTLLAFRRSGELGVDVEQVREVDALGLADRFFSPAEQARVTSVAEFFRVWTRKEACIKAIGEGLSVALHGFDATRESARVQGRDVYIAEVAVPAGYAAALASTEPLGPIGLHEWC